ncbi:MAG: GTP-binding protein [Pseudomonadota bacterium]
MKRLPLTVVGGYLGAGKTTLINRLLQAEHGLRLAVLVNDFGKINIDAALLRSARADTIELTNGCVCCTMSGDLFYAIGDILDRDTWPDHIIVEASGIADPAKIAAVALAEPDLRYAGIVTVVDGLNTPGYLTDPVISEQIKGQILGADLIALSKTLANDFQVRRAFDQLGVKAWLATTDTSAIDAFLFSEINTPQPPLEGTSTHLDYVQWSDPNPAPTTISDLEQRVSCAPKNILRVKAIVPSGADHFWEIHLVGDQKTITQRPAEGQTGAIALGLKGRITVEEIASWWLSRP